MTDRDEFDATRAAIADRGLVAEVAAWLTPTVASRLPFEALGPFKTALKRLFSRETWTENDAATLADLVTSHVENLGWDEMELGGDLVVGHGVVDGAYRIDVRGVLGAAPSIFDRIFAGPVVPEPTPHPRKVKFKTGGEAAPGVWYRRGEPVDDERVERLFAEPDVSDVMVAGDFVTVGLERASSWEDRLDEILDLVTYLFPHGERAGPERTRDELVAEGRGSRPDRREELHLADPDDPDDRTRLQEALADPDARTRRIAVAVLAQASDPAVAEGALRSGHVDTSMIVRRTAVDAAADLERETLRQLFEHALGDGDAWIRWKAVRALGDLDPAPSRGAIEALAEDPDFQVRFEVARALRE